MVQYSALLWLIQHLQRDNLGVVHKTVWYFDNKCNFFQSLLNYIPLVSEDMAVKFRDAPD